MRLLRAQRAVVVTTIGAALTVLPSCRSHVDDDLVDEGAAVSRTQAESPDTLRGIVVESGPAPNTVLLLRQPGGESFVLRGSAMLLLRRVVGLDVIVEGRRTDLRDATSNPRGAPVFDVDRFTVRAADGIAAVDGIVTIERERYWLMLQDGRKLELPNLPAALRAKPGTRVFLAGSLDRQPAAYGIIADAR